MGEAFLSKFCNSEHALPACPTIRVGTLYEYRTAEESIRDHTEGKFTFDLRITEPVDVTTGIYRLMTGTVESLGSGSKIKFPGQIGFAGDNIYAQRNSDGTYRLHRMEGQVSFNVPNQLIYCLSTGDVDMANPIRGSIYNGKWMVRAREAHLFGRALARSLTSAIHVRNFPFLSGKPFWIDSIPFFRCEHRAVDYGTKKLVIDHNTPLSESLLQQAFRSIPFTKPVEYAHEREYRFSFECVYERHVIHPRPEGIVVNHQGIEDLIFA